MSVIIGAKRFQPPVLDWCRVCRRLLNLSSETRVCNREHCPEREANEVQETELRLSLHSKRTNKGGEGGWH